MNVIGQVLTILTARDPKMAGRSGLVVLETANTLVLQSTSRLVTVQKSGSAFKVQGTGTILTDADLAGRLEDRWGKTR